MVMQLTLDMSCHLPNASTKFRIDTSKHVEKSAENLDGWTQVRTDRHCCSIIRPFFLNRRIKAGRVRPIKYTHGCVVFLLKLYYQFYVASCDVYIHSLQGCFNGTGAYNLTDIDEIDWNPTTNHKNSWPYAYLLGCTLWLIICIVAF